MVHEARDILFARVAKAWSAAGRAWKELEGTFWVERMGDSRGRECTVCVEVEVTYGTSVAWAYAYLLAPITLEWKFCVLKFECVLWVAEVGNFIVFHDFCGLYLKKQRENMGEKIIVLQIRMNNLQVLGFYSHSRWLVVLWQKWHQCVFTCWANIVRSKFGLFCWERPVEKRIVCHFTLSCLLTMLWLLNKQARPLV